MLLSGNKLHSCWYLIAYFSVLQFWAELETFSFIITSDHLDDVLSAGQVAGPLKLSSSQIHAALPAAVPRFCTQTHTYSQIFLQSIRRWTELSLTQLLRVLAFGVFEEDETVPHQHHPWRVPVFPEHDTKDVYAECVENWENVQRDHVGARQRSKGQTHVFKKKIWLKILFLYLLNIYGTSD